MAASGSADGGTRWIDRLNDISSVDNLDGALTRLLFLPIAAFFVQAANAVEAISNVVISPVGAFAEGVVSVVESLFGTGPASGISGIIEAGADATATDIGIFGIGGFPISLGIIFAGGFIIAWYLQRDETSDLIPFTFTDIPFVGTEEQGED